MEIVNAVLKSRILHSPWNAIFFHFQCAHHVLAVYSQWVHLRSPLGFVRTQRSQSAHRAFTTRSPNVKCSLIVQSHIIIFRLYTYTLIFFVFKIFIFFTKRWYIVHCALTFHFVLAFALRLRSEFNIIHRSQVLIKLKCNIGIVIFALHFKYKITLFSKYNHICCFLN